MIDALFFRRLMFSFFEATSVHYASDAVTMVARWGVVLVVKRERGGVIVCKQQNLPPAGKIGPPDRPTDGHHKAAFFFACALRLLSRSNQQNNNKNDPLFVLFEATIIVCYYYSLNYVLQCLVFCYVRWLCMAINTSAQHNSGLLPDMILLTQGQRVPRTVFFPWRLVQSIRTFTIKNHDHQPFPRTLANKNYRYW